MQNAPDERSGGLILGTFGEKLGTEIDLGHMGRTERALAAPCGNGALVNPSGKRALVPPLGS